MKNQSLILDANGHCEYCGFPEAAAALPFHVDHIIASKHGGSDEAINLPWACYSCNLFKGTNIAGLNLAAAPVYAAMPPHQAAMASASPVSTSASVRPLLFSTWNE